MLARGYVVMQGPVASAAGVSDSYDDATCRAFRDRAHIGDGVLERAASGRAPGARTPALAGLIGGGEVQRSRPIGISPGLREPGHGPQGSGPTDMTQPCHEMTHPVTRS